MLRAVSGSSTVRNKHNPVLESNEIIY
jgi:hypothetical protein